MLLINSIFPHSVSMSAVRVPDFGGIYALPEPEALRVAAPLVLLDEAMST